MTAAEIRREDIEARGFTPLGGCGRYVRGTLEVVLCHTGVTIERAPFVWRIAFGARTPAVVVMAALAAAEVLDVPGA